MAEQILLKISLAVIIVGMLFLFLYTESIDLPVSNSLGTLPTSEIVKVKGIVRSVQTFDKVAFVQLDAERMEKMDILLFQEKNLFLKKGDYVEVEGTVEEYQGKKEVIANKIVLK